MRLACQGFLLMGLEGVGGSCGCWQGRLRDAWGMPEGSARRRLCGAPQGGVAPRTSLCDAAPLLSRWTRADGAQCLDLA